MEKYDPDSELEPFGFNNMGATCYFNSMLQSMLSCTSFVNILLRNKDNAQYLSNPVTKYLIEMLLESKNENRKDLLATYSPRIWKEMVVYLCRKYKKPINEVLVGQQCAGEGFDCFLDSLDEFREIQNLFLHRYKTKIHCFNCDKWVSEVDSINSSFMIEPDLKIPQLEQFKKYDPDDINMNKFLLRQSGYRDKDFICPKCKTKGEKYTISFLVLVPEILVVLSKKYTINKKLDVMTNFPEHMQFDAKGGKLFKYSAVSQIEHVGGLHGGHYWCVSKRSDGWYNLNDNAVSKSEFKPTKQTYITFYHLMDVL